jgi:hypothetical protein
MTDALAESEARGTTKMTDTLSSLQAADDMKARAEADAASDIGAKAIAEDAAVAQNRASWEQKQADEATGNISDAVKEASKFMDMNDASEIQSGFGAGRLLGTANDVMKGEASLSDYASEFGEMTKDDATPGFGGRILETALSPLALQTGKKGVDAPATMSRMLELGQQKSKELAANPFYQNMSPEERGKLAMRQVTSDLQKQQAAFAKTIGLESENVFDKKTGKPVGQGVRMYDAINAPTNSDSPRTDTNLFNASINSNFNIAHLIENPSRRKQYELMWNAAKNTKVAPLKSAAEVAKENL